MRAVQLLAVIALGASALLLSVGLLWFFGVVPVTAEPNVTQAALTSPVTCDRTLAVRDGVMLSNAFDVKVAAGDTVCLAAGAEGTVVYTLDGNAAGTRLFSLSPSITDADLAQMGMIVAP